MQKLSEAILQRTTHSLSLNAKTQFRGETNDRKAPAHPYRVRATRARAQ